ncbi:AMP-binding protein, partial [Bacillus mobilis]
NNVYGPTETTTFATYYPINADQIRTKTPIGKPITNTTTYIIQGNQLCGIGMVGELCIAGDGVARGYLNNSELTEEKFIPN